jgi:hypothetical protein
MVNSVRVPEPRQRHQTPGATAVAQVTEVVGNLRPVTSVAAQVIKVVESLKPATSVVAEAVRVPWVVLEREEASVLPVIGARRAGVLPRVARAARGLRGAEAAVHRVAVEEEPPEVAVVAVVVAAVVVAAAVGEQEIEKNKD